MTKSERVLSRWGILMVGEIGPILAGDEDGVLLRTSTPLVLFDADSLRGLTSSGRPYRLVGEADPVHAVEAFTTLWGTRDAEVRVLTPAEAAATLVRKPNRPFESDNAERQRLDRVKVARMADEMARQIAALGITREEAADRAELSLEQMNALLEGDATGITGAEADAALVRLANSGRWEP